MDEVRTKERGLFSSSDSESDEDEARELELVSKEKEFLTRASSCSEMSSSSPSPSPLSSNSDAESSTSLHSGNELGTFELDGMQMTLEVMKRRQKQSMEGFEKETKCCSSANQLLESLDRIVDRHKDLLGDFDRWSKTQTWNKQASEHIPKTNICTVQNYNLRRNAPDIVRHYQELVLQEVQSMSDLQPCELDSLTARLSSHDDRIRAFQEICESHGQDSCEPKRKRVRTRND